MYYPHLTGRLAMDPKDRTPRIEQLGTGVKLVSAECSEPLAAFEKVVEDDEPGSRPRLVVTNLPDGGNALLPPLDASEAGLTYEPIVAVQHTRFRCGAVSIGFCLRHVICDASGFFQLVHDLAELYRGYRDVDYQQLETTRNVKLSTLPHIRSYMAEARGIPDDERQKAPEFMPTVFKKLPKQAAVATDTDAAQRPTPPPTVVGRVLRFSSSELAALKAGANETNPGKPLSTFCVFAAHVWQTVYRARTSAYEAQGLTSGEAARRLSRQLLVPIDLRSRDQLAELPPRYFPNAVLSLVLSLPAAELLHAPLSTIAAAVRDGIQPQDPKEVKKTLRWIEAQPDKSRVLPCFNYEQEGVLVTQWNKFDMYLGTELDVAPALVAQPFTPLSLYNRPGPRCAFSTSPRVNK